MPEFDRPSVQRRSLLIPRPLGFGIGPQTIRKTCALRVSATSRPTRLSCNFRHRGTAGLPGHLDYTRNFRFPHIAVGLGRCSVATRVALLRITGLLPLRSPHSTHAEWFVASRTCDTLRLRIPFPGEPGSGSSEAVFQSPFSSHICRMNPVRLTTAKLAQTRVTRGLRFVYRDRQNAFAFCPNSSSLRLLFACSIAGALGSAAIILEFPPAFAGGSFEDCNLPLACASGSGKPAVIRILLRPVSRRKNRLRSQCRSLHDCRIFRNHAAFRWHFSCMNGISSVHALPGSQLACACCLLHDSLPRGP